MTIKRNLFIASLGIVVLTMAFFSCKKDISKIGVEVVGENPLKVSYMDTITIKVHSELIDSLRTDELSSHVMGAFKDPVFGTINASIYSQFRLKSGYEDFDFGTNPQLDSIVLYIAYTENEVYGDTLYNQKWTVYEVGEDMFLDTAYYSFQQLRTKADIIGQAQFVPNFDSVEYIDVVAEDTTTIMQPIRIPLSQELGMKLLTFDTLVYEDNDSFLEAFKGIFITTLDQDLPHSGGSLVNANFASDNTYIRLYYHNDEYPSDSLDNSLQYDYVVNFSTARYSNFNHYDYADADADFRAQVINGDTTLGDEKIYLQGLGGVRSVITFPYISKMDDYYKYAINEAKLLLYDVDETSNLAAIEDLTLSHKVTVDSSDYYYTITDASSGDLYFGGGYNSTDKNYYFRITQYMQDLIQGYNADNRLRIEIVGGAVHPNRLVAGGSNPLILSDKKLKLQLIYTKIENE